MSQILIGMLALFGLGVIVGEIINNFEIFAQRLNAYWVAAVISMAYGGAQGILYRFKARAHRSATDHTRYDRLRRVYHRALIVIGVVTVLSIPFIWWGVIRKLAAAANQGSMLIK